MAYVKLYGGVTYHTFGVDEGSYSRDNEFRATFETNQMGSYPWKQSTKILANFNNSLSGSNFEGNFENIDRFKVYKTIGEKDILHKVAETEHSAQRVVEDFTVGDLCDYQYYIYSVCKDNIQVNGESIDVETISPIILDPVRIHNNTISVIGLIPDEAKSNTYHIDEDNVWQLQLNVVNDGYTLNTDKTFYQTQDMYGKSSGGNRKQRSIPVTGLLGKIDCKTKEYVDTYDYIIDWETFVASNTPKMLIDLRGVITIGDIDVNPSFSYETTPNREVSVSFTFLQLNGIDNVDILGRVLPINPLYYEYLKDANGLFLYDTTDTGTANEHHAYLTSPLSEAVKR